MTFILGIISLFFTKSLKLMCLQSMLTCSRSQSAIILFVNEIPKPGIDDTAINPSTLQAEAGELWIAMSYRIARPYLNKQTNISKQTKMFKERDRKLMYIQMRTVKPFIFQINSDRIQRAMKIKLSYFSLSFERHYKNERKLISFRTPQVLKSLDELHEPWS